MAKAQGFGLRKRGSRRNAADRLRRGEMALALHYGINLSADPRPSERRPGLVLNPAQWPSIRTRGLLAVGETIGNHIARFGKFALVAADVPRERTEPDPVSVATRG
ncbi:MAG: hypothetical protein ABIP41_03340, partial [Croceibacterium sp.]